MYPLTSANDYDSFLPRWKFYTSLFFRKLKASLIFPKFWRFLLMILVLLAVGLLSLDVFFSGSNDQLFNLSIPSQEVVSSVDSQVQGANNKLSSGNELNSSMPLLVDGKKEIQVRSAMLTEAVADGEKSNASSENQSKQTQTVLQVGVSNMSSEGASMTNHYDNNNASFQKGNVTFTNFQNTSRVLVSKEEALCSPVPPNLVGVLQVNRTAPPLEEQERLHPELGPGGRFRPADCRARHRVAIIVPFRDRAEQLPPFLNHIHPFLQKQQIDYAVYIVEQAGSDLFNKGMIMNIGALESLKLYQYDCFIFHDVDLLPENDRNLYTCPDQPRHLGVLVSTLNYQLMYDTMFGGVVAMTVDQFKTVNGFSNEYLGWGAEDDDMAKQIKISWISYYPLSFHYHPLYDAFPSES